MWNVSEGSVVIHECAGIAENIYLLMRCSHVQASLMINETEKNLRLAGGAVSFQANHAVDELGALRYVSTGMSFRLEYIHLESCNSMSMSQ